MEKSKFDDWSDVKDCNGCEHYWNALCDGASKGSEKRCSAFKATRRVDIPEQIDALRTHLKRIKAGCVALGIVELVHIISHLAGWV